MHLCNIITNDLAIYEESNHVDVYFFVSTEGALRRPMTYDDQTIQSHPSQSNPYLHPERHNMTLDELGRTPMN